MRAALVVSGGVDRSGVDRVTPAILWLVERLARRFELFVYVLRYHTHPCSYPLRGATVHDFGSPRGVFRQYRALVGAMRRDGPFAILHGYMGQPAGLVAALTGRTLGIPAIATLDSGEYVGIPEIDYGLQLRARHRLGMALLGRLATRVTVCSRYQEHLARKHGVDPIVVPLGVDTRWFASNERGHPDGSAADPVQGGPPWRLLHVASLNRVKDQPTLLAAFERLVKAGLDVSLDIVGEDTLGGAVPRLARKMGLQERVTFHGFQPSGALAGFYRRAHLFVLSSRHEAANVSVLEAAACGLAAAGTHVGYLADWAQERAATAPPGDPRALAHAIESLLTDPIRRASMAASAQEWAQAHDADWTADQFARLYEEIAKARVTASTRRPAL
jgi:glycosyltransferase involved in cell wall biosynthesis